MTNHRAGPSQSRYEADRPLIDQIISGTARQHRLTSDDESEFRSFAWERILSADPLKRFQQRCSLRTFLTVVIRNYFRDFRNHRWGKWRPSTEARRLGPVALRLEVLVARDGYSFDQAVEIMQTSDRTAVTRSELESIHLRLPVRARPQLVSDEMLGEIPGAPTDLDGSIERDRHVAVARQVRRALNSAMERLEPEDKIILKLMFENGFSVAQVAAAMHLAQKPLYRRRDQLLAQLRSHLRGAGITPSDVEAAIGAFDADAERGSDKPTQPSTMKSAPPPTPGGAA